MLNIAEIYASIQGESRFVNYPTIFVRTQGCRVGCTYCDTKFSWPHGEKYAPMMEEKEIIDEISKISDGIRHICLTGGSPEEQDCTKLIAELKKDYIVSVEASGAYSLENVSNADLIVLDLKGPSAGKKAHKLTEDILTKLVNEVSSYSSNKLEVKCVVRDREDFDWYISVLENFPVFKQFSFMLSPMFYDSGEHNAELVVEWLLQNIAKYENLKLNLQIHKFIWDPKTRGV